MKLEDLHGMLVDDAVDVVKKAGYEAFLVPENCIAITAEAKHNTVVLWQKDGKIVKANLGDPLELEK